MNKYYESVADIFCQHGIDRCFALLGDANMHWAGAMHERGVKFVYTRHEHAAVAAAAAYARALGKIGCASVTCGPGLTQIMTILPIAVRANIPMIIFAGEAPIGKAWYNQMIDQAPFVAACGAEYHALHDLNTLGEQINDAFTKAHDNKMPIVLGMPFDLQKMPHTDTPKLAARKIIAETAKNIDLTADIIETAARQIAEAKRPVILAGLGAVAAQAKPACVALAEQSGAMLATTLPAKGLFHDQPYNLGVAGGYATQKSKAIFAQSDLVIGIGARLASHSFDGGQLTPNARVMHLDLSPQATVQGRHAADLLIPADAKYGAEALAAAVKKQTGWRTPEMLHTAADALILPDDNDTPDGQLHPMAAIKQLDGIIPKTCHIVNTSGHCAYYSAQMNEHPHDHFTVIREFGAIGNGTSFAIGVATAFPDRKIVLIDGDGSLLMHAQELETIQRHNLNILIIVMNDGAYGSEIHKLRKDNAPLAGSVFGKSDFAKIANGFGIAAKKFTSLDDMQASFDEFHASSQPALWDVHISDQIASPPIMKTH
jgi:thiamine pyrophosphate-dependent acetolactate synthase large subunit-like protein